MAKKKARRKKPAKRRAKPKKKATRKKAKSPRCAAKTKAGKQCKKYVSGKGKYCSSHKR